MENIFWIVLAFLASGIGALIASMFFGKFQPAIFASCVLGIPGLLCAIAALNIIWKIITGTERLGFDNFIGMIGGTLFAVLFLSFPIAAFKVFKDD